MLSLVLAGLALALGRIGYRNIVSERRESAGAPVADGGRTEDD